MKSTMPPAFPLKRRAALLLMALVPGTSLVSLLGCGGGKSAPTSGRGRIQLTIRWPERAPGNTRVVPVAAQSLRVVATVLEPPPLDGEEPVKVLDQLVVRPGDGSPVSIVTLRNLPPVLVRLMIVAFPFPDGTGVAQARGSVDVRIPEDATVDQVVTLASTIERIVATPPSLAMVTGAVIPVILTALDSQGALVLTRPQSWSATSSGASVLPPVIGADGLGALPMNVVAGIPGAATLTVRENESGKSVLVPIVVTPLGGPTPTPTPSPTPTPDPNSMSARFSASASSPGFNFVTNQNMDFSHSFAGDITLPADFPFWENSRQPLMARLIGRNDQQMQFTFFDVLAGDASAALSVEAVIPSSVGLRAGRTYVCSAGYKPFAMSGTASGIDGTMTITAVSTKNAGDRTFFHVTGSFTVPLSSVGAGGPIDASTSGSFEIDVVRS